MGVVQRECDFSQKLKIAVITSFSTFPSTEFDEICTEHTKANVLSRIKISAQFTIPFNYFFRFYEKNARLQKCHTARKSKFFIQFHLNLAVLNF